MYPARKNSPQAAPLRRGYSGTVEALLARRSPPAAIVRRSTPLSSASPPLLRNLTVHAALPHSAPAHGVRSRPVTTNRNPDTRREDVCLRGMP